MNTLLTWLRAPTSRELSTRLLLLESLLASPRGKLDALVALHQAGNRDDPQFYTALGAWYVQQGAVRDHLTVFLGELFQGSRAQRDAALVLAQPLRTFQLNDLVQHIKRLRGNAPRVLRHAVELWLRRREASPAWWEECCLRDRRSLKSLYAGLHVRPSALAQQVLFDGEAPAGSRLEALRELARGPAIARVVELIRTHRLPFVAATGALKGMNAPGAESSRKQVLAALVDVMTPGQLVTNLEAVRRGGLLDDRDCLRALQARLLKAAKDGLVSELKLVRVANLLNLPQSLVEQLKRTAWERLRARGTLDVPTAILVDKSGSMELAIEAGLALATLCASVAKAPLFVYAFDEDARAVVGRDATFAAWELAFRGVRAGGGTSIGAGLQALLDARQKVEQVVVISDGQENAAPPFLQAYAAYSAVMGPPTVTWLEVGQSAGATLERDLAQLPKPPLRLRFSGDFYSLPNLVPLLSPGGRRALVGEVMATRVPTLDDLSRLPQQFDEGTCEIG